jgi:hypothetical protein
MLVLIARPLYMYENTFRVVVPNNVTRELWTMSTLAELCEISLQTREDLCII